MRNKNLHITPDQIIGLKDTYIFGRDGYTTTPPLSSILKFVQIRNNCTITGIDFFSNETGSITIDLKVGSFANTPASMSSICASDKIVISSANKGQKTSFTGWTLNLTADQYLGISIDSAISIFNFTLTIKVA